MNVQLTPDASLFVEGLVAAGQYPSVQDAVTDGVRLLQARHALKAQIQIGIDQADQGDLHDHDEVFDSLRARLGQLKNPAR
jgi:putative addiction module CopG family antidote